MTDSNREKLVFVLVHGKNNDSHRAEREQFIQRLKLLGIKTQTETRVLYCIAGYPTLVYTKIIMGDNDLMKFYDILRVQLPLNLNYMKGLNESDEDERESQRDELSMIGLLNRSDELEESHAAIFFNDLLAKIEPVDKLHFADFEYNSDLYLDFGGSQGIFKLQNYKALIAYFILDNVSWSEDYANRTTMSIKCLLEAGIYKAAYPVDLDHIERFSIIKKLSRYFPFFRKAPINDVEKHLGIKYAMFTAWIAFYTRFLLLLSVIGLLTIFILYNVLPENNSISNEVCNSQFVMCPECDGCSVYELLENCLYSKLNTFSSNTGTAIFAVITSIWSMILIKCWKRKYSILSRRWGVPKFDDNIPPEKFQNIDAWNTKEEPTSYLKLPKLTIVFTFLFLTMITSIAIISLMIFNAWVQAATNMWRHSAPNNFIVVAFTSAVLNSLTTNILNMIVYPKVAVWLDKNVIHRSMQERDRLFFVMRCLFNFVMSYAVLFYIAFFKGNYVGNPDSRRSVFGVGIRECTFGTCSAELSMHLFFLVLIQVVVEYLKKYLEYKKLWIKYHKVATYCQDSDHFHQGSTPNAERTPNDTLSAIAQLHHVYEDEASTQPRRHQKSIKTKSGQTFPAAFYRAKTKSVEPSVTFQLPPEPLSSLSPINQQAYTDSPGRPVLPQLPDTVEGIDCAESYVFEYGLKEYDLYDDDLYEEYINMAIQYGFLVIFAPVAPIITILVLISTTSILIPEKILNFYRRPVPLRKSDIQTWIKIFNIIGNISFLTQAIIIAYSSNWLPRMVYQFNNNGSENLYVGKSLRKSAFALNICHTSDFNDAGNWPAIHEQIIIVRFIFVILYQNIMYIIKFLINHYISDVPAALDELIIRDMNYIRQIKTHRRRNSNLFSRQQSSECSPASTGKVTVKKSGATQTYSGNLVTTRAGATQTHSGNLLSSRALVTQTLSGNLLSSIGPITEDPEEDSDHGMASLDSFQHPLTRVSQLSPYDSEIKSKSHSSKLDSGSTTLHKDSGDVVISKHIASKSTGTQQSKPDATSMASAIKTSMEGPQTTKRQKIATHTESVHQDPKTRSLTTNISASPYTPGPAITVTPPRNKPDNEGAETSSSQSSSKEVSPSIQISQTVIDIGNDSSTKDEPRDPEPPAHYDKDEI